MPTNKPGYMLGWTRSAKACELDERGWTKADHEKAESGKRKAETDFLCPRLAEPLASGKAACCPYCGSALLWSEERGAHCDGCDDFESESVPSESSVTMSIHALPGSSPPPTLQFRLNDLAAGCSVADLLGLDTIKDTPGEISFFAIIGMKIA